MKSQSTWNLLCDLLEFYLLPDLEIKEFEIGKLEDDLKNSFDKFYLYLHNFDKVVKIINIMVKKYRLEFKNTFFNLYETDTRLELHQKENILFKLIEFADAENLKHDVIKFVKEYYKNEYEIKPLKIHITPEKKDLINEDILNEIIKKLSNVENSITYWEDLSYYRGLAPISDKTPVKDKNMDFHIFLPTLRVILNI